MFSQSLSPNPPSPRRVAGSVVQVCGANRGTGLAIEELPVDCRSEDTL
ncbi:hypothetical protein GXB81_02280 [Paraburkholderia sp. Ac-20336]|nr:hypothetical protein [Paraburkholderia sp. Cy-641]MBN3801887.1 hypothetical protein [Paraburkholderia sp. Ac-20336]